MKRLAIFLLALGVTSPGWAVIEFDRPFATATTIPIDFRDFTDGSFDTTGTTPDCEYAEGGHDDTPSTYSDATNEATEIATDSGNWFLNVEVAESDEEFTYVKCTVATADVMPFFAVINHVPDNGGVGNTIAGTSTSTVLQVEEAVVTADDEWVGHTLVVMEGNCKRQGGVVIDSDENTTDTITISPAIQTCTPASDLDAVGFVLLPPGNTNVAAWLNTAPATPTTAGVPEVDVTYWEGELVPEATSTGVPQVDVQYVDATAQDATDLADFAAAGYDPGSNKVQGVVLVDTTTTNTDMVSEPPTAAAIVNEWETQSQADPTGFHVNVLEVNGTAQTANDNGADINDILVDTSTTLDNYVDDLETRLGTPSDLGGGATVAFNLSDIEGQTDDIGAAGVGLTEAGGDGDHLTEAGATGDHLTAVPWNAAWDAQVQSEVTDGLEADHLDHLFAADYDPATPPGTATAWANELVESDGGVARFTTNALENAPSGTGSDPFFESGTAAGSAAASITLAETAYEDDSLINAVVLITSGDCAGQNQIITDYVKTTDVATVQANWATEGLCAVADINGATYELYTAIGAVPDTTADAADTILTADCSDAGGAGDSLGKVCEDWADAGRLDAILDARMAEASIDTTAGAIDAVTTTTTVTNDVGVNEWNGVALSSTNPLPNAAADAAGGLVISDAGGLNIDQIAADTTAIVADTGTDGVVLAADSVNSSAIATTGADEIRDTIITADQQITVANGAVDADLERIEGQLIGGTASQVADNFTQFYNITPTTTNTVDDVGATAATDWTAGEQNQMRQALGITGTTAATTGTGEVDLIFDEVANLDGDAMRGTDSAATATALSTHDGKLDTVDTNVDSILVDTGTTLDTKINTIDTNVDAILVDTGTTLLGHVDDIETRIGTPSNLGTGATLAANTSDISGDVATVDSNVDSVLVDTGTTLDGKIDTIDGNVDAVLVDTGTTLDGKINTIDSNVDSVLIDTGTTLDGKINTVDSNVDTILVDTADMQPKLGTPAGASMSADIASVASDVTTVDGNVDAVLVDTGTTLDTKINTIDANVDSVLSDTGTDGVVTASGTVDTCTNITQVEGTDATDQIRDAVAGMVIEGSMPLEDVLAIILARQVGTVTKSGDTYTVKDPSGTTTRITFDVSGTTRSNVTMTPP